MAECVCRSRRGEAYWPYEVTLRPSDFTEEVRDKIIASIKRGNYLSTACEEAGVPYRTFKDWMDRGEGKYRGSYDPDPAYAEFASAVRQAEAEVESTVVSSVYEKSKEDPNVALRFLAVRFKPRWQQSHQTTNINVSWVVRAAKMIEEGDVTWELLEDEIGKDKANQVRAYLEAPQEKPVEAVYKEVEQPADAT